MLTKSKSSCKTGWWLEMNGRPMAKFGREEDIDYIIELQNKAKAIHIADSAKHCCDYSLGA
jgi:hypothetical protein